MESNVILVDRITNVTVTNGIMRVECASMVAGGQDKPSGTVLIPVLVARQVVQVLVNSMQELEKKAREAMAASGATSGIVPTGNLILGLPGPLWRRWSVGDGMNLRCTKPLFGFRNQASARAARRIQRSHVCRYSVGGSWLRRLGPIVRALFACATTRSLSCGSTTSALRTAGMQPRGEDALQRPGSPKAAARHG